MDWASLILVVWAIAAAVPLTWIGFHPGTVEVVSGPAPNVVIFDRRINRDLRMRYSVIIRDTRSLSVQCEASSAPFTYRAQPSESISRNLEWWAPDDERCATLPPDHYVMETCWTWYSSVPLIPPKTVCRKSNIFEVTA
jgi:hypothetical protein